LVLNYTEVKGLTGGVEKWLKSNKIKSSEETRRPFQRTFYQTDDCGADNT